MEKQTAVEWLVEELTKQNMFMNLFAKEIDQAKAMEKEQIEQAYYDGGDDGCPNGIVGGRKAERYYNETFSK
jgi:hypothetical protein